jgi:hypothetical protein
MSKKSLILKIVSGTLGLTYIVMFVYNSIFYVPKYFQGYGRAYSTYYNIFQTQYKGYCLQIDFGQWFIVIMAYTIALLIPAVILYLLSNIQHKSK